MKMTKKDKNRQDACHTYHKCLRAYGAMVKRRGDDPVLVDTVLPALTYAIGIAWGQAITLGVANTELRDIRVNIERELNVTLG